MIVENQWYAGAISVPFYLTAFLSASLMNFNAMTYVFYGAVILLSCGVTYHHLVIKRVKGGCSQLVASSQWLAGQLILIFIWYTFVSIFSIYAIQISQGSWWTF
jgi:hypothetical protein